MILNAGMRTDIPAFFSEWFYNRVKEGYVLARNPYYPEQVTRYLLNPDVVDCISFCTKNPGPMLERLSEIDRFRQYWSVTITPYGRDIEPYVPDKEAVMDSLKRLSEKVGKRSVAWRYDPIFLVDHYDLAFHIRRFEKMAASLSGYVDHCVISFLDLYQKTRKNFPKARKVTWAEQQALAGGFVKIGKKYGIRIKSCCENAALAGLGVDVSGCLTKEVLENALGVSLQVPKGKKAPREGCTCLLGSDIGMYHTCGHGCIYCYANDDRETVRQNIRLHDPASPFLIGGSRPDDIIRDARQVSHMDRQLSLFFIS